MFNTKELKKESYILFFYFLFLTPTDIIEPEKINDSPLLEDVKKAIVKFCNEQYDDNNSYEEFNELYPDLSNIGIAYGETPDEKYEISFVLNLVDHEWYQKVDDKVIDTGNFVEPSSSNMSDYPLNNIKAFLNNTSWEDLVRIDDEDKLKAVTGLEIDDDGNFYDPLAKDMDNDGIPDRYDHDFRDSDYEESTFDVDGINKEEKPSILGQIKSYQNESKSLEKQDNKDKEQER